VLYLGLLFIVPFLIRISSYKKEHDAIRANRKMIADTFEAIIKGMDEDVSRHNFDEIIYSLDFLNKPLYIHSRILVFITKMFAFLGAFALILQFASMQ